MPGRAAVAEAALLLAVLAVAAWYATAGNWRIWDPQESGSYYDALAVSLAHGHLDVPFEAIGSEAFRVDGKHYGYFGPVPALPRGLLTYGMRWMHGRWSRASLVASVLVLWLSIRALLVAAGVVPGSAAGLLFLTVAMFGSTVMQTAAWPTVYVEAIAWGAALALAACAAAVHGVIGGSTRLLALSCVLAALAFFTRVPTGAGALVGIALATWIGRPHRRADRAAAALTLAACATLFVWLNWVRFGTLLDGVPIRYHVQYSPERLARIGGTLVHPEFALRLLPEYLLAPVRFRASYPWVEFGESLSNMTGLDGVDPHAGLLIASPFLAALAMAGIWRGLAGIRGAAPLRALLLAQLAPGAALACFAFVGQRYVHDWFPLLAAAGAFGLRWLVRLTGGARAVWWTLFVAAAVWSLAVNPALTMVLQREWLWGVDEDARARHRATRYVVDQWIRGEKPGPVLFEPERDKDLPPPVKGLEVVVPSTGSRYRFDGVRWQRTAGPPLHQWQLKMRLDDLPAARVSVLFAGVPSWADSISLDRDSAGSFRFCTDHWGTIPECGPPLALRTGQIHDLLIDLDRFNRRVRVILDGRTVLERRTGLHRWSGAQVQIGRNPVPETHGPPFPGLLEAALAGGSGNPLQ